MSREVIIETRNLSKVYVDFWGRPKVQALKALDLKVYKGEIFGVLGPNGSGKTTTIKLLLGLLFPSEGDALIFNEPTTNVAKNERIGYLPEESYLYKFLNAEETLHFYGKLFKISKAERTKRVGRLIDMVGLNLAKHRQLREYSKGMQRRIGLAQALINNPELILLDEPTSGLDPIGTAEIKELIRDLKNQGKTVVLSGHLLADMQDICDRIAILHRGELKELGKVSDLLTVQDVTQIKTRNLSPAAIEEIRGVIQRHGAELLAVDHPTTTLEELFLRIVRESDLRPGRRKVGDKPADAAPGKPVAPSPDEFAGTPGKKS
jgi:ABC-2 type transport system ATP-binding protein